MNPVLICFLEVGTFFFLVCEAARTRLAQGRVISHTLCAVRPQLATKEDWRHTLLTGPCCAPLSARSQLTGIDKHKVILELRLEMCDQPMDTGPPPVHHTEDGMGGTVVTIIRCHKSVDWERSRS